jgi:mono/diheme cytochrome c family protein
MRIVVTLGAILVVISAGCKRPAAQPAAKGPATVPAAIVEIGGGKQVSTTGAMLDQPLVIQVNDAQGAAVPGASVTFRSAAGVGFQPSSGVTGSDGQFTFAVILGSMAGRYQIVAATTGANGKPVELKLEELALGFQQNHGRQLADLYCSRCHDPESTPERVSNHDNLTAQAHAFTDGAFLNKMSDADLIAIIQHGGPALGKPAEMPPYARTLNKADIQALVSYIRAVADPPYPAGEALYAQR